SPARRSDARQRGVFSGQRGREHRIVFAGQLGLAHGGVAVRLKFQVRRAARSGVPVFLDENRPMIRATEPTLQAIREKVQSGARLSFDDGMYLYRADVPLPEVGELANLVRERKNGNRAFYNINTHLNPTNVCLYRCVFCAFRSDLRSPKGYLM